MDIQAFLRAGPRRRLVNLAIWPVQQLKLPFLLLAITGAFVVIFAVHTWAAYGSLMEAGFATAWIHDLAQEIRRDYVVVSGAIGFAYAVAVLTVCLAGAHRLLGPIVALERHLNRLRKGDYSSRVELRAGHPLRRVADDLNALADLLPCGSPDSLNTDRQIEQGLARIEKTSENGHEDRVRPTVSHKHAPGGSSPWFGWYTTRTSHTPT